MESQIHQYARTYSVLTHTLPLRLGQRSKHFFFLKVVVMLYMECVDAHSLSLHTPLTCGLDEKVKKSECGHDAYQFKGKEV